MATRRIKDAKDLATNELIYFKSHAKATFMSDGKTVEEAIKSISTGGGGGVGDTLSVYELDVTEKLNETEISDVKYFFAQIPTEDIDKIPNMDAIVLVDGDVRIVLTTKINDAGVIFFMGTNKYTDAAYVVIFALGDLIATCAELPNYTKSISTDTIDLSNLEDEDGNKVSALGNDDAILKEGSYFLPLNAEELESFKNRDKVFHLGVALGDVEMTSDSKHVLDWAEYNYYEESHTIQSSDNQVYLIRLIYSQDEYPDKLGIDIERAYVKTKATIDLDFVLDYFTGKAISAVDENGNLIEGVYKIPADLIGDIVTFKNRDKVLRYYTPSGIATCELTNRLELGDDEQGFSYVYKAVTADMENTAAFDKEWLVVLAYNPDEGEYISFDIIRVAPTFSQDFVIDLNDLRDEEGNKVSAVNENGSFKTGEYVLPYSYEELKELEYKKAEFKLDNDDYAVTFFPVVVGDVFPHSDIISLMYLLSDEENAKMYSVFVFAMEANGVDYCTIGIEDATPVKQPYFYLGTYDETTGTWDNSEIEEIVPDAWEHNKKMLSICVEDPFNAPTFITDLFIPTFPLAGLPIKVKTEGVIIIRGEYYVPCIKSDGSFITQFVTIGPDGIPVYE